MTHDVFLYDAVRTPFGKYGGALSGCRPDDLAALVVRSLVGRNPSLDPARIDEVVFGNANGAGEDNRNVARMAGLLAGVPVSVPAVTVNRLCGSSLEATITAARQIALGESDVVLAGGVESMSRAPWVLPKPERAFPAGDARLVSTALGWRLVNPAMATPWTVSLGEATERLREREGVSREDQDAFALRSHQAATAAWDSGFYAGQVVDVPGVDLARDEPIRPTTLDALAALPPVFRPDGTVTAGNASPLSDGASAALLGSAGAEAMLGRAPLARVAAWGVAAGEPQYFGIAPVAAAHQALRRAGITWSDITAVELNEAFAAQSLACVRAWDIDPAIVNRHGGAIALGHPLGASGTRIIATLAHTLRAAGGRWGLAAICVGVGQGLAVVLENAGA
ncbi:thiolase family protein [Streptomyces sp. NPDC048410]|uniref:thiolase family protein n=1 Tax=Streptomyces sp. NPDC048410 TaxID=3365545 RepID=UPI0037238802